MKLKVQDSCCEVEITRNMGDVNSPHKITTTVSRLMNSSLKTARLRLKINKTIIKLPKPSISVFEVQRAVKRCAFRNLHPQNLHPGPDPGTLRNTTTKTPIPSRPTPCLHNSSDEKRNKERKKHHHIPALSHNRDSSSAPVPPASPFPSSPRSLSPTQK